MAPHPKHALVTHYGHVAGQMLALDAALTRARRDHADPRAVVALEGQVADFRRRLDAVHRQLVRGGA